MKRESYSKTEKLFARLNEEKASGLSFSAAIVAQYVLTLFFLIIARFSGRLTEGYENRDWFLYCSYLIPQAAFFITACLFFSRTDARIKDAVKKPRPVYFIVAVAMQCGLLSLSFVNTLFLGWLEKFGYTPASPVLPSVQGAKILPVLLAAAVLPACLEELFFRGILLGGMKKFGTAAAVFYGAALFALYHQSPAQTVYQFICGACFALIALRSGSILPTVVSHFINNAFIIVMTACGVNSLPVPLVCAFAALLVASLCYLLFFDKSAGGTLRDESGATAGKDGGEKRKKADVKGFTLCALIGIIVCALSWAAALFA
ncbi:MAG: type II CAAX endopeptidase family protein [Candidatus Borkfalkiaceae bacterium]|nr:type II CAAX endopeptidase family protein [Clostridia bacterium]MDY6223052.1 type II CAAX endopeptidase family protein [Christensenellaceae bacterium]